MTISQPMPSSPGILEASEHLKALSSRDRILAACEEALRLEGMKYYYSWGAPEEEEWIHGHHRLLILLEGQCLIQYYQGGKIQDVAIKAPVMLFCPTYSYLRLNNDKLVSRIVSLGFMHNYIRTMHVDTDGIHPSPTDRDTFYHTDQPLCKGGMRLLETIDTLIQENSLEDVIKTLLWQLLRLAIGTIRQSGQGNPVKSPHHLWSNIMQYLRTHREEQLSREYVARVFNISPGYISKLMKQFSASTFSEMQLECRLEHAAMLLRKTTMNVSEIAFNCGFNYANYFIRRFRTKYGMTPFAYRNIPEEQLAANPLPPK